MDLEPRGKTTDTTIWCMEIWQYCTLEKHDYTIADRGGCGEQSMLHVEAAKKLLPQCFRACRSSNITYTLERQDYAIADLRIHASQQWAVSASIVSNGPISHNVLHAHIDARRDSTGHAAD
jgi:hypothetical protein